MSGLSRYAQDQQERLWGNQTTAYRPKGDSFPGVLSPYSSLQAARYNWLKTARPEQIIKADRYQDLLLYLFVTGRGWGKTRTCAEEMVDFVRRNWKTPIRGALVGPTFADARDTMLEGVSGILNILPPSAMKGFSLENAYNRSLGELTFSNGSKFKVFTSIKPRALRGPQHHIAWAEEIAQWQDAFKGDMEDTTWSNMLFGLRLGKKPYVIGGTTPRNVKLLRQLIEDPRTIVVKGKTRDNLLNLSDNFARTIIGKYHGTRLGRQELLGELLIDVEGALWKTEWIDRSRVFEVPSLSRVVISIDVATTKTESSDETGIVAIGMDDRRHCYVLADMSGKYTPGEWTKKALFLYDSLKADAIVYEANNGGDLIPNAIHNTASSLKLGSVPCRKVHATRDKKTRAEPVAHLYELSPPKVHHVDYLTHLEDQLVTWDPLDMPESPDRLDALVWGVTFLTKMKAGLR
ncbi:terminase large subunit domain-containing protein [Neptunomonas sp.]|uniref:terminase large subunit domain-containing protein n=1 Tax=Neptunomonas sp. TaxID=1971898 RepID=UPI0035674BD6